MFSGASGTIRSYLFFLLLAFVLPLVCLLLLFHFAHRHSLSPSAVLSCIVVFFIHRLCCLYTDNYEKKKPAPGFLRPVLLVSILSMFLAVYGSSWDRHAIAADTPSYCRRFSSRSVRPPVYPYFIRFVNMGRDYDERWFDRVKAGTELEQHPVETALRVVRAQKIALLLSLLLMATALMLHLPPYVVSWLFAVGIRWHIFVAFQVDRVLTEALWQSFVYLLTAVFLVFIARPRKDLLVVSGLIAALAFLTRSAGAVTGILLAVMYSLALYRDWRGYLPAVLAGVSLGCLSFWPALIIYRAYGVKVLTAKDFCPRLMWALQIAEPDDIRLMPDGETAKYLSDCLEMKARWDRWLVKQRKCPRCDINESLFYNLNYHRVAIPLARKLGLSSTAKDADFYRKVSAPIIRAHPRKLASIVFQSLRLSGKKVSRLRVDFRRTNVYSFWTVLLIAFLSAFLIRRRLALIGISLLLLHSFHIFIICLFENPLRRFVYATEGVALTGLFFIAFGISERVLSFNKENIVPEYSDKDRRCN